MSAFNLSLASSSRSQESNMRFQATHAHSSIQGSARCKRDQRIASSNLSLPCCVRLDRLPHDFLNYSGIGRTQNQNTRMLANQRRQDGVSCISEMIFPTISAFRS